MEENPAAVPCWFSMVTRRHGGARSVRLAIVTKSVINVLTTLLPRAHVKAEATSSITSEVLSNGQKQKWDETKQGK